MKKRNVLSVLALACLAMSINLIPSSPKGDSAGLEASTIDYLNEKENIERVSIRRASDENAKFDMSSTYVQWAHNDEDGYDYIRFATALSGDYKAVSYTRHVSGLNDETDEVTAVYKGISAAGETTYSNGDGLRDMALSSTKNYYWACYTIRFTTKEYITSDITVTINVDGKTQSRTANLSDLKSENVRLGDALKKSQNLSNLVTVKDRFRVGTDYNLYDNETVEFPEGVSKKQTLVQGMTTDGTYIYYTITIGASNENDKMLYNHYKYNPATGEHTLVMKGGADGSASGDFQAVKYIDGVLYTIDNVGYIPEYGYKVSGTNGWSSSPYAGKFGDKKSYAIYDFVKNPLTNKYAVLDKKGTLKFYDESLNYLEGKDADISVRPAGLSTGSIKSMDCDDKYIYVLYIADEYHGVRLAVYDWAGAHVTEIQYSDANIYPHSNSTKVSTFTILGNKIYLGSICWAGSPYNSALYSLDFNIGESTEKMSLKNILYKSSLFSVDTSEVEFKHRHKVSSGKLSTLQSGCTDGEYVYYSVNDGQNTTTAITKYDVETGSIVGQTAINTISDAQSYSDTSNIFYYNGRIYLIGVANSASKLYSIAADAITADGTALLEEDTTLPWFPNVGRNGTAAYYPELKIFVISNSSGLINKYSESGTLLTSSGVKFTLGGQGIGLSTNGKDLYYCRSSESKYNENETDYFYDSIIVQRMDWNLNKIGAEFEVGSKEYSIGEKTTVKRGSNMQTFIDFNGVLLAGRLVYQKTGTINVGSYIYEVEYECKKELSNYDSSYRLGEYIEEAALKDEDTTYSVRGDVTNVGDKYLQGAVAVNDYIYFTDSNNKEASVGRYNPYNRQATISSVKTEISPSSTSGDYGKLFYYDDSLWLIHSDGSFIGVDLDTLDKNDRTLTLDNLPSDVKALDCGYSAKWNTLVVLGTNGNLYLFDKDLNLTKTIYNVKPTLGSLYTVTVSEDYIYVNGNGNGMKGVGLRVFDLQGNEIADTSLIVDDIAITKNMKACKVLDFNGIAILTVLGWSPDGCSFFHINIQ